MTDVSEAAAVRESPLLEAMREVGGVVAPYHTGRVVRHFGAPADEYAAAAGGVAVFDRSHRTRVSVSGRAPRQMLDGVLTGRLPGPPDAGEDGVATGEATYHAVLTPKGRMITDLWALLPGSEEDGFLLDVPLAGAGPLRANFGKVLPPRFARWTDVSERFAALSVVGPQAAELLSREAVGLRVEASGLEGAKEGRWWRAGGWPSAPIVVRTREVWPDAFDVYVAADSAVALWRRLVAAGARPAGLGVLATLRVEAGRPVFGTDMDDRTIPVEAGIHDRAIDYGKGCYTGQEVIVRIRDRGHVNRHLRRLELGDVPTPSSGTELQAVDGSGKVVGSVTTAVQSPRFGGVIAMAYVRRGVDRVLVGDREVAVHEL